MKKVRASMNNEREGIHEASVNTKAARLLPESIPAEAGVGVTNWRKLRSKYGRKPNKTPNAQKGILLLLIEWLASSHRTYKINSESNTGSAAEYGGVSN